MRAVLFDGTRLSIDEIEKPVINKGETLIRVLKAGICNTDLEITKGYMQGFKGVPGHEFFGTIEASSLSIDQKTRVTAEINCGCKQCMVCKSGDERHCPGRTVIGILGRDGCFAQYISVPDSNVRIVPDEISDINAVFIEPLAAAFEILEQITVAANHTVALFGDGKLGQLIAHAIATTRCDLTAIGIHPEKLDHLKPLGVRTCLVNDFKPKKFDIVIEATGVPETFAYALSCVRPRGIFVLKSTYAGLLSFNPAPIIIDEITIVGSRCGRFEPAIHYLQNRKPDFSCLVDKEYSIDESLAAFNHAATKGTGKIIIDMT